MPLVEHELLTLPENLSPPPVFSEIRVTQSLVSCVVFIDRCPFDFFILAIELSFLRFTNSDYPLQRRIGAQFVLIGIPTAC